VSWLDQIDREVDLTKVTRYQGYLPRPHVMDGVMDITGGAVPRLRPRESYVIGEWPGIDLDVLRETIEAEKVKRWLRP